MENQSKEKQEIEALKAQVEILKAKNNEQTKEIEQLLDLKIRYKGLFFQNPIPTFIWKYSSGDFVLIECNKAANDVTNNLAVTYIGLKASFLFEQYPENIKFFEKCFNQQASFVQQIEYKMRSTGFIGDFRITYAPVSDVYLLTHSENISDRMNILRALRQSEEKYRVLTELLPEMIYEIDSLGILTYVNRKWTEKTGYQRNELIDGFSIFDILNENDAREVFEQIEEIQKNGVSNDYEFYISRKSMTRFSVINYMAPILRKDEIIGYRGIMVDITDRKKAENIIRNANTYLERQIERKTAVLNKAVSKLSEEMRHKQETEIKLRDSELKYRLLFENIREPIVLYDLDGKILMINGMAKEVFGNGSRTLVGKSVFDILDVQTSTDVLHNIQRTATTSVPFDNEMFIRINNKKKWFWSRYHPVIDTKRNLMGVQVISQNITKRKKAEQQLQASEHLYYTTVNSISNILFAVDYNEKILLVNDAFLQFFEKRDKSSNVIGKVASEVFPDYYHQVFGNFKEIFVTGNEVMYETEIRISSAVSIFEVRKTPVFNGKRVVRVLVTINDITLRKRVEQKIQRSEKQLRAIFDNSLQMFVIIDKNLTIQAYNKQATQSAWVFFGRSIRVGAPIQNYIIDEERNGFLRCLKIALSGKRVRIERQLKYPNQSNHWFEFHYTPVRNSDNQVESVFFNVIDINQRKQAAEDVRRALKREKELNQMKSRFVTTVSHEFRTPLAGVRSSTQLLEKYHSRWDENRKKIVFNRIYNAIHFLLLMLDDVSVLGQQAVEKLAVNRNQVDIEAFCMQIIEEMHIAIGKKVRISFKNHLSTNSVSIDKKLLRHILINLLSNAIKYSPENKIVKFELSSFEDKLFFSVEDKGIGILPKDLKYIFEPFHRGENVNKIKGTGLGMSIVKQCVDHQNGTIEISSKPNEGTIVVVGVPLILNKEFSEIEKPC